MFAVRNLVCKRALSSTIIKRNIAIKLLGAHVKTINTAVISDRVCSWRKHTFNIKKTYIKDEPLADQICEFESCEIPFTPDRFTQLLINNLTVKINTLDHIPTKHSTYFVSVFSGYFGMQQIPFKFITGNDYYLHKCDSWMELEEFLKKIHARGEIHHNIGYTAYVRWF
ncbi:MAG: hypothetical protein Faunusvirus10_19 [Faunusvirus sp.]|jgi:hypothetical protein|uniref:Uncharacterized protein n=1 Tax=Faunusvirus sp. TaxID=2487766 RepID=A0A3G4ZWS4_9VIRU|nr:MAG: hypothetical protein Faunusvirus10_19 [Faunusvirus sp.]